MVGYYIVYVSLTIIYNFLLNEKGKKYRLIPNDLMGKMK